MPQNTDKDLKAVISVHSKMPPMIYFFAPLLIWIFLLRDFVFTPQPFIGDTFSYYAYIQFFIKNLIEGVYPLWNPFVMWGIPVDVNIRQIGEFNPIVFVVLLGNILGIVQAFLWTMIGYFFFGCIGFYFLVRWVVKDSLVAYGAFLLLLFSSIGLSIFNQLMILLIFVPVVWFFYFLFRFCETWQKRFFLGLIFSLMIILTTYLPFYFLTILLLFILLFFLSYFSLGKKVIWNFLKFCQLNKQCVSIACLAIFLSLVLPYLSYRSIQEADYALQTRHSHNSLSLSKGAQMDYEELKKGGLSDKMSVSDFFSNPDLISVRNDGFIYLPIFAFVIAISGFFIHFNKRMLLLTLLGLILFLLALADASCVHGFLFRHVFYFKFFRNLYFFTPFLIAISILFVSCVLKSLLNAIEKDTQKRCQRLSLVLAGHLLFIVFLSQQENVPFLSYATVFLSVLFFTARSFTTYCLKSQASFLCLFLLIVLQPAYFFHFYSRNFKDLSESSFEVSGRELKSKMSFSFLRPAHPSREVIRQSSTSTFANDVFNNYVLQRQDSAGFIAYRYGYPAFWSYQFFENIPVETFQNYVKIKFWLYDQTARLEDISVEDFRNAIESQVDIAYLSGLTQVVDTALTKNSRDISKALAVDKDMPFLKIKHFDVNTLMLQANLPRKKFLVYNDSFHRSWKGFINGREVPIYRANMAFKGLWIPEGQSEVVFSYQPWGGARFYFSILFIFFGFFVWTLLALVHKTSHVFKDT